jgi:hypothetical protein
MGAKQTAFITDLTAKQTACDVHVKNLKIAVGDILTLSQQIDVSKDAAAKTKLKADRNKHFGTLVKERGLLAPLATAFGHKVADFSTFVEKKSKRWVGKSTLPAAKTFLKQVQAAQQHIDDVVKQSLAVPTS